MGRHSAGPRIIKRGKIPVLYAVFPDGHGKKIYARIIREDGTPVSTTAREHEVKSHAWRIFGERRRETKDAPERQKTIGELTLRYVEFRGKRWSTGTQKRYLSYLEKMEEHLDPTSEIGNFSLEDAEEFLKQVSESTRWASGTLAKFQEFCSAIFNYGKNLGWIEINPLLLVPPPKVVPVRISKPFTEKEIVKILIIALDQFPWFYPAVVIAVSTGARRSEIAALSVGSYDPTSGKVHFAAETTKTQEENNVKLPPFAQTALNKCVMGRAPSDPLILKPSGKPLRSKDFDLTFKPGRDSPRIWRKLLVAAGVELRGVHKLRTALITNLVNQGQFSIAQAVSLTGQSIQMAEKHYLKSRIDRQGPVVAHLEKVYGEHAPSGKRYAKADPRIYEETVFEEL